jgi:hypothetical protein
LRAARPSDLCLAKEARRAFYCSKIDQPPLSQMKPLPLSAAFIFAAWKTIAAIALAAMTVAEISGALAP